MLLAEAKDANGAKRVADMAHAAEIYARRQRLSQDSIDYAHAVKIDAMTLLGDFLRAQPKATGSRNLAIPERNRPKCPTLRDSNITLKESALSQKLSRLAEEKPQQHAAIRSAKTALASVFSSAHVSHNSGNNEWYTPKPYIAAALEVLGAIDLDPASSKEANSVIGAGKFFSAQNDGLKQNWTGRVWMNPPYSSELIGLFCDKLSQSFASREIKEAVALVNNATETLWFQSLCEHASALCFPKGRVKFWNTNKESTAPLQGQALVYLGPKPKAFAAAFHDFGICAIL
jgi:phage N-6-adenine-methyltransferase